MLRPIRNRDKANQYQHRLITHLIIISIFCEFYRMRNVSVSGIYLKSDAQTSSFCAQQSKHPDSAYKCHFARHEDADLWLTKSHNGWNLFWAACAQMSIMRACIRGDTTNRNTSSGQSYNSSSGTSLDPNGRLLHLLRYRHHAFRFDFCSVDLNSLWEWNGLS